MNIALLGVGLMGLPMGRCILRSGHRLIVFNRTVSKALVLQKAGAFIAGSASEAIQSAECIILMLSDRAAIDAVLFSQPAMDWTGRTFIQMGTISPAQSISLQQKIYHCGGEYLECPVLGSRKEAMDGRLILLAGSSEARFNKWQTFLSVFGTQPRWIGDVGKAAALKLALNHLIASHATMFSISLALARSYDVNVDLWMEILRASALYAPMYDKKLSNWLSHQYDDPNFPVKHLLKDVRLVKQEVLQQGIASGTVAAMECLLEKSMAKGLADLDYSAIYEVIKDHHD